MPEVPEITCIHLDGNGAVCGHPVERMDVGAWTHTREAMLADSRTLYHDPDPGVRCPKCEEYRPVEDAEIIEETGRCWTCGDLADEARYG